MVLFKSPDNLHLKGLKALKKHWDIVSIEKWEIFQYIEIATFYQYNSGNMKKI